MKLERILKELHLARFQASAEEERAIEILGAYASDLLSDVLAHAPRASILVTVQTHMNVVAVALHAEVAAVIFTCGLSPEEAIRKRAASERLPLYGSALCTFDVAGRLYGLGLRGSGRCRGA
jgi:hypothetical protein